jgi:alpha-1,6-mannosyltransferase
LLLFELSANAHNDALMLTLVLAAFVCCSRRWMTAALVALVLSAMVKYVTLLILPIFLLYWARQQPGLRRQIAILVGGGLVTLAIVAALYAPWYAGAGTFAALRGWTTTPLYANSPTDILARDLALLLDPARESQAATLERVRAVAKWIALAVLAAHLVWETWRVRTLRGVAAASARVLLTFLLVVSPWVLPWYFTWPLMFGLLAGWDSSTGRLTVLFSLTAPAVLHYLGLWGYTPQAGLWNVLYLAPLALPIAAWVEGRRVAATMQLAPTESAELDGATDPFEARAA